MASTGIRELKDKLSQYVRQVERGKRIAVTAHGRVVAELVPPAKAGAGEGAGRYEELVAVGIIEPAVTPRAPSARWPDIRVPAGTVTLLLDSDRGEA
ncbi:MAG: type II toxin-antitoxin system Phd/YefM family antitoxin [Steroidobacteraceae bacterium]